MSAESVDKARADPELTFAIVENIDGILRSFQVAALNQDGAAKATLKVPGSGAHIVDARQFHAEQDARFRKVRSNQRRYRQ